MSSIRTENNENQELSSFVRKDSKQDDSAFSAPEKPDPPDAPEVFRGTGSERAQRTAVRHRPEVFARRVAQPAEKRKSRILVHPSFINEVILCAQGTAQEPRRLKLPDISFDVMMEQALAAQEIGLDELVILARERDEEAIAELHERFLSLIHSVYHQMELKRKISPDDWVMEARISLLNCIELYTFRPDSSFAGYYKAALKNLAARVMRDSARCSRVETAMTFSDLESMSTRDFKTEDVVQEPRDHKEELDAATKFQDFLEDLREKHSDKAADMLLKRAKGYRIYELADDYEMTPNAVTAMFRRLRQLYRKFDTQYNR